MCLFTVSRLTTFPKMSEYFQQNRAYILVQEPRLNHTQRKKSENRECELGELAWRGLIGRVRVQSNARVREGSRVGFGCHPFNFNREIFTLSLFQVEINSKNYTFQSVRYLKAVGCNLYKTKNSLFHSSLGKVQWLPNLARSFYL